MKISGGVCDHSQILRLDPCHSFPAELFNKILSSLPFVSLHHAMLVSRGWRNAAECPSLWRKLRLRVREERLWMLSEVLKIPRLSRLEQCRVIGVHPQPDRWEHALRGRELEELGESSVTQLLLSNVWVSPAGESGCQSWSKICKRLTELTLSCTVLDPPAVLALLEALAKNTVLVRLTIDSLVNSSYGYGRFIDLSIAPPDLLMNAVANLQELHLCRVELSTKQLVPLFENIARGKFQEVNLSAMDLSQVPSEMFSHLAAVVPRLEFHHARLTDQQVKALLERVVSTKAALAKLKHLDIEYNMIETVDQQLIEDAGLKLDKFYFTLNYTDMDEQSFFDNHDEEEEEWDDEDDQY